MFFGVGIQPAFAVAPNTSDSKKDCNLCPKVSSLNLVRLKSLLNRLEKYDNILSELSRNHPNVAEKYPELSDKLFVLKQLSQEIKQNLILKNNDLICSFLFIIGVISAFFWITNYQIMDVVYL